ncbi:hypothetical protein M1M90_01360 [Thermodesulfovibrionales bacterium]|nr:hypothetical protein [Thermodesulfovibrionales bacterium]
MTAVLAIVLLVRASRGFQGAAREVRDELCTGREEARGAAKELREEVSVSLKTTNETLSKTLEGIGKMQQSQIEGTAKQLKELFVVTAFIKHNSSASIPSGLNR